MRSDPSPQPLETRPAEGLLVANRYRLVSRLGAGAMGSVWRATHVTLGHDVAVKFLHQAEARDRDSRSRFEREAKLAARLGETSRHVARVVDHGVMPDGVPFLVMELLVGEGLDARLRREGQLAPLWVLEIVRQLARALQVAHEASVVHRDLKPANVFLCTEEDGALLVKLVDFGVAKAHLETGSYATTQSGSLIGTPMYMSPEQFDGTKAVDARSDLWALTAMIYRMLVGFEPFHGSGLSELALRIVASNPSPPTTEDPRLPKGLDGFVARGLAKRPEDRFQSARELLSALEPVMRGEAVMLDASGPESIAKAADDGAGLHRSIAGTTRTPSNERNLTAPVVVGLVGMLIAGGIALAAVRMYDHARQKPEGAVDEERARAAPVPVEFPGLPTASANQASSTNSTPSAGLSAHPSAAAAIVTAPIGSAAPIAIAPPVVKVGKPSGSSSTNHPGDSAAPSVPDLEKKAGVQWNDGKQM